MRTQQEIEQEIEQVDAVLATFEAEPGEDSPVALRHTYRKNTDLLATLKAELSTAVAGQLRWKIENDVVHGHAIELGHLSGLLHEFDRSTRYFGADIARVEDPQLGAPVEDVVSPMLVGTFEGSFGLILKPRGSGEQMQLLSPPLFERTLARILDVLTAIAEADEDLTDVLLEKLAGMGSRSVGAVRDLSRIMSEAGGSSVLVWEPSTETGRPRRAHVTATQAGQVDQALRRVTAHDPVQRQVRGLLVGSDIADKTFHLVETDTETEYRGKVEASVNDRLNGSHGRGIVADIEVSEIENIATSRKRPTYRLINFRPA